jgi:Glycogen debranching enzyme N terminal
LLLTKLDEVAVYANLTYALHTNRWTNGSVASHGYHQIESFILEGTVPTWRFACIEKTTSTLPPLKLPSILVNPSLLWLA